MAMGVGDAPFLRREVILRRIELNVSAALDQFPMYSIFLEASAGVPRVAGGELVKIDLEYNVKRVAPAHQSIGVGDRLVHTRFGQKTVQMIYNHLSESMSPQEAAQLRIAGMDSNESAAAGPMKYIVTQYDKIIRKMTLAVLRWREYLCCKWLSESSFTITMHDGSTVTVATGVPGAAFGGAWGTAATDIPGLLGTAVQTFVDQAGEDPTHFVYSFRQGGNLSKNDKLRAWAVNQLKGNTAPLNSIPNDLMPEEMKLTKVIRHKSHYTDSSNTKQYYWPIGVATMFSNAGAADAMEFLTCELVVPDPKAGPGAIRVVKDIFEHEYFDDRTLMQWIDVHAIGAPYIGDTDKFLILDLTS